MTQKIIVIGAGVVGASIAYYLSRRGADVTILEKAHIAAEASGSSFGWLNANFPELPEYFKLRQASLAEYASLLGGISENVEAQFKGCIFWELLGEELQNHYEALKLLGYSVELIESDEFQQLEPGMTNVPSLAISCEQEGAVDAERLTKALLKLANIDVLEQWQVIEFIQENDRVIGVKTVQGDFLADTVVIAAGVSADQLLAKLNVQLPMNNSKGFIITTKATNLFINRVLFGPDIHFKQLSDGAVVIGDWLHDVEGDVDLEKIARRTMERFVDYFPDQKSIEIDKITCAYRPMPEDSYSVIGKPENIDGVYIASTHSGVTLAPIIGKLAAQEILDNDKAELLNAFRIERFN